MQNKNNFYFLGICLVIASIVISLGFSSINPKEASVSVRGLAQREVNADLAVWQLSFGLGDNNLENLQKSIKEKSEIVSLYLKDKGLNERDFSVLSPSITNNLLDPYINQEKMQYIYIAKLNFLIRTDKISAVKKANEGLLELVDKGIAIKQDYENKYNYYLL